MQLQGQPAESPQSGLCHQCTPPRRGHRSPALRVIRRQRSRGRKVSVSQPDPDPLPAPGSGAQPTSLPAASSLCSCPHLHPSILALVPSCSPRTLHPLSSPSCFPTFALFVGFSRTGLGPLCSKDVGGPSSAGTAAALSSMSLLPAKVTLVPHWLPSLHIRMDGQPLAPDMAPGCVLWPRCPHSPARPSGSPDMGFKPHCLPNTTPQFCPHQAPGLPPSMPFPSLGSACAPLPTGQHFRLCFSNFLWPGPLHPHFLQTPTLHPTMEAPSPCFHAVTFLFLKRHLILGLQKKCDDGTESPGTQQLASPL